MDSEDEKWIDEAVGPKDDPDPEVIAKGPEEDYEFEMWLSTDGKNSVRVSTNNPKARKQAMLKAVEAYEYLRTRYGTKQEQNVKTYSKDEKQKAEIDKSTCSHTEVKFAQAKTEKNRGRWFKVCKRCNDFLGWQD